MSECKHSTDGYHDIRGICQYCHKAALDRIAELEKANAELNHKIGEYVDKTAELAALVYHDVTNKKTWKRSFEITDELLDWANKRMAVLEAENERMRKALKWYMNNSHYGNIAEEALAEKADE